MLERGWLDAGNEPGGPAVRSVRGSMPTIWGHLEHVDSAQARALQIQVRTVLPGGIVIRVRANIGAQTLIARGTDAVDVSDLREGEFVEVSYRQGKEGRLHAVTIYVRPEQPVVS
jgi:hypothetical protein